MVKKYFRFIEHGLNYFVDKNTIELDNIRVPKEGGAYFITIVYNLKNRPRYSNDLRLEWMPLSNDFFFNTASYTPLWFRLELYKIMLFKSTLEFELTRRINKKK